MGCAVNVNGLEVWAEVLEADGGARMRLARADWEEFGLEVGDSVPVRLPGGAVAALWVAHVTERKPVAWVVVATRPGGPTWTA